MKRTVVDLFCGAAGGWSLGLHRAGFRTVAACESDPWRRAVFLQNNPDVVMYDDVRTLTGDRIVSDLCFRPDIVVGSPPCQDASIARRGDRTGIAGERTGLFSEYLRLVRELRPAWACAENVLGLVGVGADEIASEMVAAGYQPRIIDMGAEDFGSTAERRRLWFIAVANAHEARLQDAWRERRTSRSDWLGAAFGSGEAARNPWQQGEGDALRMAAGIPTDVACMRIVGAYGDSVVPQITEAIGRSIEVAEAAL